MRASFRRLPDRRTDKAVVVARSFVKAYSIDLCADRHRLRLPGPRNDSLAPGESSPPKDDVPHAVSQSQATALELGDRPVRRWVCVVLGRVAECGLGGER